MSKQILFLAVAFLFPFVLQAEEAKPADGAALVKEHCVKCHGDEVYTRSDRKINSKAALQGRVEMCNNQLGTQLFDEDLEKITNYLNEAFYKFK